MELKCDNKKEEVNVEHRQSIEPKEKNKTRDNNNISFDDDSTDNYMLDVEKLLLASKDASKNEKSTGN
uniref:Uncharacterized protein n=1 Tax=Solanum lycopersicum TaxID=4081 RepID=A0A3Q7EUF6_SOLLC